MPRASMEESVKLMPVWRPNASTNTLSTLLWVKIPMSLPSSTTLMKGNALIAISAFKKGDRC